MRTPRHDRAAPGAPGATGAPGDLDARRLAAVMHATFFVLLATAVIRYVQRHGGEPRAPWVLALAVVLAALYVAGRFGDRTGAADLDPGRPTRPRLLWLGTVVAVWVVLVALAPSFAWVAVPLFYVALRHLPPAAAYTLVALLTVFVIGARLQLAPRFDLDLVVGPAAVAGFATAIFVHLRHQAARQRALIDDLVRTRRELAATERREGTLAERQRLAMEIHDTLAQGLSSQQMLLQAAERVWESDRDKARAHVRTAGTVAEYRAAAVAVPMDAEPWRTSQYPVNS
ncbi:histidine kinase, partial [Streptomyces sp. NPDC003832]